MPQNQAGKIFFPKRPDLWSASGFSCILNAPLRGEFPDQKEDLWIHCFLLLRRLHSATVNEPKTEDTDHVLAAGLRQAARADAAEDALRRMQDIVETEKHRVAPNCATCTMRCGNTDNYDLARLWDAPEELRTLKLRLLAALFTLAQRRSTDRIRKEICDDLFVLAEDWDSSLLSPIVRRAEELCKE